MPEPKDACEFLEMLREQNKEAHQNFTGFLQYFEAKARQQGVPIFGQFELTPLCNLNCGMCYVHLMPEQMQNRTLLDVSKWEDLMRQAFEAGMMEATLTGGECLTYPGFDELYLFLQELGCQVTVMTNGTLIDEARIHFFEEHPPSLVQITLYGGNEEAYERVTGRRVFQSVIQGMQRVKEAGIPLTINITPNPFLGEDVFETIRVAKRITDSIILNTELFLPKGEIEQTRNFKDLDDEFYVRILRFFQEVRGIEIQEIDENTLPEPGGSAALNWHGGTDDPCGGCVERGLECGGGRSSFVINWKGEMCLCNRMSPRSFPLADGFRKAWKDINAIANDWPRTAACKGCAYEEICTKCAARRMKCASPGEQPVDLCRQTRYMVSKGVLPMPKC